jgi:hypothetical protein
LTILPARNFPQEEQDRPLFLFEAETLMNIGPLIRSPEELSPAPGVRDCLYGSEGAQLLEVRTGTSVVYVCPSRWQRIRLRWAFRHFHVLAPEVLSRHDQRLVERLAQSALVTPPRPVPRDAVFGVVEKVRTKSTQPVPRLVTTQSERIKPQALQSKPDAAILPRPALDAEQGERNDGFQQWGALGALAAACVVVILMRVYGVPLLTDTEQIRKPPMVSRPVAQRAVLTPPPAVRLPKVEPPKHRIAPPVPEPTLVARETALPPVASGPAVSGSNSALMETVPTVTATIEAVATPESAPVAEPVAPSASSQRLFVSELPQGDFVRPVASDPNLVGELDLRALIGADGSVKQVSVVSGDPKLAEAGMRAVRRWHYSQYQALRRDGEAETLIRMNFFGQDAVSVTSIAR